MRWVQNAHECPSRLGSIGRTSVCVISIGRFARPGIVQTSVPEKGLICLMVPSAILVMGGGKEYVSTM